MDYKIKYFKYKKKYLELKNQKGGSIDDYVGKEVKIGNENHWREGQKVLDYNEEEVMIKDHRIDTNKQQFIIDKNGDHYKFRDKNTNNCLTSRGNNNDDKFYMNECNNSNIYQNFDIKETLDNNRYLFNLSGNNKCLDTSYARSFHLWDCWRDNANQQINIFPNINNNDDNYNHIIPHIQNLILSYIPAGGDRFDPGSPMAIAERASLMHGNLGGTQSAIWCPLIFNALKKAGYNFWQGWTTYNDASKQAEFETLSEELSRIPGWANYALRVLQKKDIPHLENDFYADGMFDLSDRIRDEI